MIITIARILRMYNPPKMIAMMALKSIFVNYSHLERKEDRVELPEQEYINLVAISILPIPNFIQ